MQHQEGQLTAFGEWVEKQPTGILTEAARDTELAYSTVHKAKTRLVSKEVAELLSEFTKGAVTVQQMQKPRRRFTQVVETVPQRRKRRKPPRARKRAA